MFDYDIVPYMIRMDIALAKAMFYKPNADGSRILSEIQENPADLSYVGYFCGQAIEKGLKYFVERYNPLAWDKVKYTHDIDTLLDAADECLCGFRQDHADISHFSRNITCLKNMRYVVSSISKDDAFYVMGLARNLFAEVEKDFDKEIPDRKQMRTEEKDHYERRKVIRFKRPMEYGD